jgi:Concanavalin A-like lectin/glucanases superfamily
VNSVWLSVGSVQNDNKSIHLRVGSGGYVRFGFYNNDLDSNTGVFSANKWNHIVNTYDVTSGNRSIYVNGSMVAHDSVAAFTGDTVGQIGYWPISGERWLGRIDDVRIYNRALSATEIKQLYNLGAANVGHSNTIISNGLVGHWTFDDGSIDWHTNTVADMSGQGNTGSLISMSTTSSPVPGKIGQAMNFNGASNYIDLSSAAGALQIQAPRTVTGWINTPSFTSGLMRREPKISLYLFRL